MSAETLRRAASLMRERAKTARAGRWVATGDEVSAIWNDGHRYVTTCDSMGGTLNAQHIASWHPAVALAVADWLDATALRIEEIHESLPFSVRLTLGSLNVTAAEQALAVARAYLGETA